VGGKGRDGNGGIKIEIYESTCTTSPKKIVGAIGMHMLCPPPPHSSTALSAPSPSWQSPQSCGGAWGPSQSPPPSPTPHSPSHFPHHTAPEVTHPWHTWTQGRPLKAQPPPRGGLQQHLRPPLSRRLQSFARLSLHLPSPLKLALPNQRGRRKGWVLAGKTEAAAVDPHSDTPVPSRRPPPHPHARQALAVFSGLGGGCVARTGPGLGCQSPTSLPSCQVHCHRHHL